VGQLINWAETRPDHEDPRLRGRTLGVPFDRVWTEALSLAKSLPRWTVTHEDDIAGVIRAESRTLIFRFVDDVEIRVGLDSDGHTRFDMRSASRVGKWDLGTNARRIDAFQTALDQRLSPRR
jgi:uncharacterized protein (DUF1499 family)